MLFTAFLTIPELPHQGLSGVSDTKVIRQVFEPKKWKLDWSDEFDHGTAPDESKWAYEEGYVRNREVQFYTRNRRENARIERGNLVIEARKDNFNGKPVSSASLNTKGKKLFLYGRLEVRAKIPTGLGTWPAIWTLGDNISKVGWPKCGELDIMENVGFDPLKVHANVHCETYNHSKGTGKGNSITVREPWAGFHVYAMEWFPDHIDFFFDDNRYMAYFNEKKGAGSWPFDAPQYLIMNIAMGGAWGGTKGVDDSLYPHRMEIDYVRYYKAVESKR